MNVDLTPIVNAIIALATTLITAFVIPWIKRKTNEQDREDMLRWVDIAVAAAQQLHYQLDGDARKSYVLEFLESKGFSVNDKEIENAIEAAVFKLNSEMKQNNDGYLL